jgi:hypothetical protein
MDMPLQLRHTQTPYIYCILYSSLKKVEKQWRSWLRHYATKRKVADSNPDEVIGSFPIYLILAVAIWHYG